MSVIIDGTVDQGVKLLKTAIDVGVDTLDTTQNLLASTGVQAAKAVDDLGDLGAANVRKTAENFKTALDGYAANIKKLGSAAPIP